MVVAVARWGGTRNDWRRQRTQPQRVPNRKRANKGTIEALKLGQGLYWYLGPILLRLWYLPRPGIGKFSVCQ